MPILDLQTAELGNRVRRSFGMRGALVMSLDDVAIPTIRVFDATRAGLRTSGYRFFSTRFIAAGGAGTFGTFNLWNPLGSGVAAVVDQLIFANTTAAAWGATWYATPGTSAVAPDVNVPELTTDTVAGQGPLQSFGNAAAATGLGTTLGRAQVTANSSLVIPTEITLLPGVQLLVQSAIANVDWGFSCSGVWYPVE